MRTTQTSSEPTLLQPGSCVGRAPHLLPNSNATHPGINIVMFTRRKIFPPVPSSPKISSLLKAVRKGFLKGYPNMTKMLILNYLNPSAATAKGHMKRQGNGIQSTQPKLGRHVPPTNVPGPHLKPVPHIAPLVHLALPIQPVYPLPANEEQPGPNIIADDGDESIVNIFCFGAFANKKHWHRLP